MINTLKNNIRNKAWWIAVISALLVIAQQKGVDLTPYIGSDWKSTLDTIFYLAMLFGISVNTNNEVYEAPTEKNTDLTADNTTAEVQTETTTTAVNNVVTQNSVLSEADKLEQLRQILNN